MKLLIRMMGLMVISLIVIVTIIYLINISIIINEINNVSVLSLNQCQKQYINNSFKNNEEYSNSIIEYFNSSVKDKDIYDLSVLSDYDKGIMLVSVKCNKYSYIKTKKLLNIVDKQLGYLKPIEYSSWQNEIPNTKYYIEDNSGLNKLSITSNKNWNSYLKSKDFPQVLYSYTFKTPVKLADYNIKIYALISTASDITSAYWYPGLSLEVKDINDNWIVIDSKDENNYKGSQLLKGSIDLEVKEIKLNITSLNINNGYETKINKLTTKNSYINYYSKKYAYVTKWGDQIYEDVDEGELSKLTYFNTSSRYIDNTNTLKKSSIFLKENDYLNKLKEFIKKYEEIN